MAKKRTKADKKKRGISNCSFMILDNEGKTELVIEEGKATRINKESDIEKGEKVII